MEASRIDLEKMHEENRKRLVEAKMQEVNLMDNESLLLETATNSSSKNGSIYSTKKEIASKSRLSQLVAKNSHLDVQTEKIQRLFRSSYFFRGSK